MGENELGMLVVDCVAEQVIKLATDLQSEFAPIFGSFDYRIENYPDAPSTQIASTSADTDDRSSLSSEVMPA